VRENHVYGQRRLPATVYLPAPRDTHLLFAAHSPQRPDFAPKLAFGVLLGKRISAPVFAKVSILWRKLLIRCDLFRKIMVNIKSAAIINPSFATRNRAIS
jgi:hypothetical protein